MKEKTLLFILLFHTLFKTISLQTLIIPIHGLGTNNKNNDKDNDEDKPIIETKILKDDKGNNIKITRIQFHKTKNLHGDSEAVTPFQIMRVFDDRVNSIFEDIIRQTLGIRMIINGLEANNEEENEDNNEDIKQNKTNNEQYVEEKDVEENEEGDGDVLGEGDKNKKIKKKEKRILKKDNSEKEDDKKTVRIGKLKVNLDNIKNKTKKRKKKLSRKEIIFSRVCKYIFYSIILFTIYILVKKLLEVLEIIDPDNTVEIKIENEETSNLKKTEAKQN